MDNFLRDFFMAGLSAAISKTAVAPFERAKLIVQNQEINPKIVSGEIPRFTGIFNCINRNIKEDGFCSLWRGNIPNVIRFYPTQLINFTLKGMYQGIFCPFNPRTDPGKFFMGNMLAGTAAGATSLLFVYPLDFASTKLQVDLGTEETRKYKGLLDLIQKTVQSNGVEGLYAGYSISIIGIFSYRFAYFFLFDFAKGMGLGKLNVFGKFCVAQLITIFAGLITYPIDTVRRRLILQVGEKQIYEGVIDCFKKIYQNEGFLAFFKGAKSNILRGILGALVLVFYDEILALLLKKKKQIQEKKNN